MLFYNSKDIFQITYYILDTISGPSMQPSKYSFTHNTEKQRSPHNITKYQNGGIPMHVPHN